MPLHTLSLTRGPSSLPIIHTQVCGLSHAGHAKGLNNHGRRFSVTEQVQHKADYLADRMEKDPKRRFVLMGHSVGAYICLELLGKLPRERVAAMWGLYPTVQVCVCASVRCLPALFPRVHSRGCVVRVGGTCAQARCRCCVPRRLHTPCAIHNPRITTHLLPHTLPGRPLMFKPAD